MFAAILAFFKNLFGAVEEGEALAHDSNERTAGKNEVVAADLKAEKDAAHEALDVAVNFDRGGVADSLRRGDF